MLNEAKSLRQLCHEILTTCRDHDYAIADIIFVDDGSTDDSWECIQQLSQDHGSVRGIQLSRNFGKAAALAAGFAECQGKLICTLDADLQDDPANLPRLMQRINEGCDLVTGFRRIRQDNWRKRVSSKIFNAVVSKLTHTKLHDHNCGFKILRTEVAKSVKLYGEMHRFIPALAHANGFRIGQAEVVHRPRIHGQSKYTPKRIIYAFFDLLTVLMLGHFRYRPLHFLGGIGMIGFMLGFLGLAYLAVVWLFTQSIGGRPLLNYSLASLMVGCQFMIGGVLAEVITASNAQLHSPYLIRARTAGLLRHRRGA